MQLSINFMQGGEVLKLPLMNRFKVLLPSQASTIDFCKVLLTRVSKGTKGWQIGVSKVFVNETVVGKSRD